MISTNDPKMMMMMKFPIFATKFMEFFELSREFCELVGKMEPRSVEGVPSGISTEQRNLAALGESEVCVECFRMTATNPYLLELLECLKAEKWVLEDVRKEDWIYRLTGRWVGLGEPLRRPIQFTTLNQCRYIVKHLIYGNNKVFNDDWEKAERIFAVRSGKIENIRRATKTPTGSDKIDKILRKRGLY